MSAFWLRRVLPRFMSGHQCLKKSPVRSFEILEDRSLPSTISFAFIGDFGNNSTGELQVANLVDSWNPDFVITLGDNNYPAVRLRPSTPTSASTMANTSVPTRQPMAPVGGQSLLPLSRQPRLANPRGSPALPSPYLDYFTLPGNERYYSYFQGPVEFFVLDSGDTTGTGSDRWTRRLHQHVHPGAVAPGQPWPLPQLPGRSCISIIRRTPPAAMGTLP